jgi:cell filamentation protein
MGDDPPVYPGTHVLRNRLGIRDASELARRENDLTFVRLLDLRVRGLPGRDDLAHLHAFHRHIFGDIYPWAGEIRTVAIATGDLFALPQHIESYLAAALDRLADERDLTGLHVDLFIDRLAHYLAEINATHTFREGNGRAQRAFLGQLGNDAGYRIAWERTDPSTNNAASIASIRGDNRLLRAMLADLVEPAADA